MLALDKVFGPIEGVLVYGDHADPGLFHYASQRPRLARAADGRPELVFLKYRRDITDNPALDPDTAESLGGGLLSFTVELSVEEDRLERIERQLARHATGPVRLAPISFRDGTVRLAATEAAEEGSGPPFVERVFGAVRPSLVGCNRATFSVSLDAEGATLFEAAIRAGFSPLGVQYDLEFLGLRPAFHVRVVAEYHRIHEQLQHSFAAVGGATGVALAAAVDDALERLVDAGMLRVEVLVFSTEQEYRERAQAAVEWAKTELLKDFFEPALTPPPAMTDGGQELLGMLRLLGSGPTAQESSPTLLPSLQQTTGARGESLPLPTGLDSGQVSTAQELRTLASQAGGGPTIRAAYRLRHVRQEELKRRELLWTEASAAVQRFPAQGLVDTLVEGMDLSRALLAVDLDDDFFRRLVSTVSVASFDEDSGLTQAVVELEYPARRPAGADPKHQDGFSFTPAAAEPRTFTTWLNDDGDLDYRYRTQLHFRPASGWGGPAHSFTGAWAVTRDRRLVVDPFAAVDLFRVEVRSAVLDAGAGVERVQVDVRYEDPGSGFVAEDSFVLPPDGGREEWKLRLPEGSPGTYRWRPTWFLPGNARRQGEWVSTERRGILVGSPFTGRKRVRVLPRLDPNELVEAVVTLRYREEDTGWRWETELVFEPEDLSGRMVDIPTMSARPGPYEAEVVVVQMDGSVREPGPVETDAPLLLVSAGAGQTRNVSVTLIGDLAASGFAALKLELTPDGADAIPTSSLWFPGEAGERRLTVVQDDPEAAFGYRWTVTAYTRAGVAVPGGSGHENEPRLVVGVPGNGG